MIKLDQPSTFQTLNLTREDDVGVNSRSYHSKEVLVALVFFLIVSTDFLTSISPQLLRVSEVRITQKTGNAKQILDLILSELMFYSKRARETSANIEFGL